MAEPAEWDELQLGLSKRLRMKRLGHGFVIFSSCTGSPVCVCEALKTETC